MLAESRERPTPQAQLSRAPQKVRARQTQTG